MTTHTLPLPPGPPLRRVPEYLSRVRRDFPGAMIALADEFGDLARLPIGRRGIVIARGAEAARHILVGAQDRYPKAQQFELFRPVLGDGLVTSSGETWRRTRRMVQPMFAKRHLGAYADHMAAAAADALVDWETRWPPGHVVDLDREILTVGLDTVGRALATHDFSRDAAPFERAMGGALHEIGMMSRHPLTFGAQDLPGLSIVRLARAATPRRWRRYQDHAALVESTIAELVDDRLERGHGGRDDLLRLLLESEDPETGERLDRQQVIDEVKTVIAAGHETTAHGLAWMFFLLADHPEAAERLGAEVDAVLGAGELPGVHAAEELLPWTRACFQEALRLYPPAWILPREATVDDAIEGFRIPAGSRVLFSIWSTHRDPAVYDDPDAFRPDRWVGDAASDRPRFSYLPFGGGRRACVGQGFAMLNATILGAMIARAYRFERIDRRPVRLDVSITLRPRDGLPMRAVRRERVSAR